MQIKLKNVYREVDRHGKERFYFREGGKGPRVALPLPSSPEFTAAYLAASSGALKPKPRAAKRETPADLRRPQTNTLRWLCSQYFASPEFQQLAPSTQTVRRQLVEHCLKEPIAPGVRETFADFPLDRITPKAIRALRNRKKDTPAAANSRVSAFRLIFGWGLENEPDAVESNPARDVKYLKGEPGGYHSWTVEEVRQFEKRHPIGTRARLALALLLYTSQRRSDVVRLGPANVFDGWLRFTQQKGSRHKPVDMEIPIAAALQRVLDESPVGKETFLETSRGKPFAVASFGNWFRKRCDEANLPHCSAHGLRKAAAAMLAEAGASDREIMAITGHVTSKEIDRYTRGARQRVLANKAMLRLVASNAA